MDLLITDPRIAPTDNINVEESNNLWGTIVSDDTRYIGQTAQVAHLWQEGKPGNFVFN